jgi:hypothetical protein
MSGNMEKEDMDKFTRCAKNTDKFTGSDKTGPEGRSRWRDDFRRLGKSTRPNNEVKIWPYY